MPEAVVAPPVAPAAAPSVPAIPVFTEQTYDETGVKPAESGTPAQNTDAQAPSDAPAESGPTDEQPEQRSGKHRYERRLDKANKRAAEQQARADFLQRQWDEANKPKEQPSTGAPRLEDFTDIQEYAKAYAKHESDNAIKNYTRKQSEEAQKQATERLASVWEAKVSKGDKKYDDFDDVVGELQPNNAFTIAIMQAENGEDIAYYLGSHMKEAQRIASLDPFSQVREIGKLETKLLAEPVKAKTPSKAPAPITPVSGKSGAASDEPLDTDSIDVWMKKANAKSRKAIGA